MVITTEQREQCFKIAARGRGGFFFAPEQREVLVNQTLYHFSRQVAPDREKTIYEVKNDPQVKKFIPFVLMAVAGAVISWIVMHLMDEWFKGEIMKSKALIRRLQMKQRKKVA